MCHRAKRAQIAIICVFGRAFYPTNNKMLNPILKNNNSYLNQ
jgi:hypothetical protein